MILYINKKIHDRCNVNKCGAYTPQKSLIKKYYKEGEKTMKKKKVLETFLLTCVFTIAITTTAFATVPLIPYASSYKWATPTDIKWYYTQQGTYDYSSSILAACNAWEYSTSKFNYSENFNYNWHVFSKNYGYTSWDGITNYITKETKINDYHYSDFAANTTELVSHELGHCNGLGDSYDDLLVLMRWQGYSGSAIPTASDLATINLLY